MVIPLCIHILINIASSFQVDKNRLTKLLMDPTTHSTTADVHIPFHAISVPAANLLPKGHQDNAADSDANVLSALTTMMNDEPDGTQPIEVRRDETPPDETPHEETNHDETNHEDTNHDETNHDETNHDETNHDETTYGDAPNTASMTISPLESSPPRQTPSNCNGNILPRMCRAHDDDMCSMVVRIKRVYLHKLHAHNVEPIDDDTDKYLLGNICCENCIETEIGGEGVRISSSDVPSSTGSSSNSNSNSSSENSRSFRGVWGELKSTMADTDQVLLSHRAVFLGGISSVLSLLLLCFLCFACRSSSSSGGTSKHYEYENEEGSGSATGGRSSSGETEGLLEKSPSHRSTRKSKSTNRKKYARRKKGVENSDRD